MDIWPPVAGREAAGLLVALGDLAPLVLPELRVVGRPAIGHRAAEISRRGGEIGEGVIEQLAEITHALLELGCLQEGQAILGHEQPAGSKATPAAFIELAGEQHRPRPDRVCGIDHDHVEALVGLGHKLGAVGNHDPAARIVIGAGRDFREIPPA